MLDAFGRPVAVSIPAPTDRFNAQRDLLRRLCLRSGKSAASFLRGVTARVLLKEVAPLQRDDTVLFHSAAGGVGLLFAQWARALGVRVIGTVSNEAKAAAARQAGCVEVIDYMKETS